MKWLHILGKPGVSSNHTSVRPWGWVPRWKMCVALGIGGLSAYVVYLMYRAYRNLDDILVRKEWRSWGFWIAHWLGRTLKRNMFLPLAAAGEDKESKTIWTWKDENLIRSRNGVMLTQQPLDVGGGVFVLGGKRWDITVERLNHMNVVTTLVPISSSDNRLPNIAEWEKDPAGWKVRRETGKTGFTTSVAENGMYSSATLTAVEEAAVRSTLTNHGTKTTPFSIASVLKTANGGKWKNNEDVMPVAAVLASFWTANGGWQKTQPVAVLPRQALQFLGDSRDTHFLEWKATGTVIGPELAKHCDAAPVMSSINDMVAVHARLDAVRNPHRPLDDRQRQVIEEFITRIRGFGTPWSIDQVLESQLGPLQKVRNNAAKAFSHCGNAVMKVKAMLKKEAIANSGPTRNISTFSAELQLRIGRFTLALSKHLKEQTRWYCGGLSPTEIAERVVLLARDADTLMAADISKMDSSKNVHVTAHMLLELYCRFFPDGDRKEIETLFEAEVLCTATTTSHDKYVAAGSQLSGSSTTTNHNTITNALLAFDALERKYGDWDVAWTNLDTCLFMGDDSLTVDLCEHIEAVGLSYGYKIVAREIKRGEEVDFLSRWFPRPWAGDPGSYQDIDRLLRKSHISFSDPAIGREQMALNKWMGYRDLDPAMTLYTAIYCSLAKITGKTGELTTGEMGYMQQEYHKNGFSGWPQLHDADEFMAKVVDVGLNTYIVWLNSLADFDDFLRGPGVVYDNGEKIKQTTVDPTNAFAVPEEFDDDNDDPIPEFATVGAGSEENRRAMEEHIRDRWNEALAERRAGRRERRRRANPPAPPRLVEPPGFEIGQWHGPPDERVG